MQQERSVLPIAWCILLLLLSHVVRSRVVRAFMSTGVTSRLEQRGLRQVSTSQPAKRTWWHFWHSTPDCIPKVCIWSCGLPSLACRTVRGADAPLGVGARRKDRPRTRGAVGQHRRGCGARSGLILVGRDSQHEFMKRLRSPMMTCLFRTWRRHRRHLGGGGRHRAPRVGTKAVPGGRTAVVPM